MRQLPALPIKNVSFSRDEAESTPYPEIWGTKISLFCPLPQWEGTWELETEVSSNHKRLSVVSWGSHMSYTWAAFVIVMTNYLAKAL